MGSEKIPKESTSRFARPIEDRSSSASAVNDGSVVDSCTWQQKAESALAAGDVEAALGAARTAVEYGPEVAHNHVLLANALDAAGHHGEAAAAVETARTLDRGRSPGVLALAARLHWRAGDEAGAAALYGSVLDRDPGDGPAREALAKLGAVGARELAARERSSRPIRLAGFPGRLRLDGYGPGGSEDDGRRGSWHPAFGPPPFNVGDQFVGMALARVLRFSEFRTLLSGATAAEFDRINRECDLLLMPGSCFLYPGFARHIGLEYLKRIRIPIVYVGGGLQFDLQEPFHLTPQDVECLRWIHGSCASCSVRGPRSAQLLADYGIRNVRVTGCPTIVWSLRRELTVRPASLERVAWTITDMAWSPEAALAQFHHMRRLHEQARRLHFVAQGGELVLQRWIAASQSVEGGDREDVAEATGLTRSILRRLEPERALADLAYYYRGWPAAMLDALQGDAFYAKNVHEYLRFFQEMSLVCGTRLHGNLMALAQGIPAVFCVHDARVADMVEVLQAPAFTLGEEVDFDPSRWDWAPFERRYPVLHDAFVDFFAENGLPHNLRDAAPGGG